MRINRSIFITLFLLFHLTISNAEAAFHRIILIGNSITLGKKSSDNLGFRDELFYRLQQLRFPFEFVGDTGNNPFKGHFKAGAFIGDFYSGRGGNGSFNCNYAMDNFDPTIAVIHLGSNDFWLDEGPAPYTDDGGLTFTKKIAGKLAHLVHDLLRWNDGTRGQHLKTIFVCKIIPKAWRHEKGIRTFNAEVEQFVEDVNLGHVPSIPPGIVQLIDQYSTFNPKTMLDSDGTHPNRAGYRHMARVFEDALKTFPLYLNQVAGNNQTSLPNIVLPQPLSIRITDGFDENCSDVPVHFEVIKGDAQILSPTTINTNSLGIVSIDVQMGYSQESKIRATASGLIDSTTVFTLKTRKLLQAEGQVSYYSGIDPVPAVDLIWKEKEINMGSTDHAGIFRLDSLPRHQPVTLKPQKESLPFKYGSTILSYDAALIARHVVGLDSLTERQKQAADIDRDNHITMMDAVHAARYAVGLNDESAYTGDWVFHPSFVSYDSLTSDLQGLTFSGIVLGDVHGGWVVPQDGLNKNNNISLSVYQFQKKDTVIIQFQAYGSNLLSCDLELSFPHRKMIFMQALKKEASKQCTIISQLASGFLRLGLFGFTPIEENVNFLELKFIQKEMEETPTISIHQAIMDNVWVGEEYITTSIEDHDNVAHKFKLGINYPNPFNSETVIPFTLSNRTKVELKVYNIVGREVRQLANRFFGPGDHQVHWDGCDGKGRPLPSGIYFAKLTGSGRCQVQKIELIR